MTYAKGNGIQADDWTSACARIRHDLKAFARHSTQLSDWISEDLADEGGKLPEAIQSNLELMRALGTDLKSFVVGMDRFLLAGTHPPGACKLEDALDGVLSAPEYASLTVTRAFAEDAVPLPATECQVLLQVVLANVVAHCGEGPKDVAVTLKRTDRLKLSIRDFGLGLPESRLQPALAFGNRYGTSANTNGFGLATAARICGAYGAKLTLANVPDPGGLVVTVAF